MTTLAEHATEYLGLPRSASLTLVGAFLPANAYRPLPHEPLTDTAVRALAADGYVEIVIETNGKDHRTRCLPLTDLIQHLSREEAHQVVATYRADVDAEPLSALAGAFDRAEWEQRTGTSPTSTRLGAGEPACRCFRCGTLLTAATVHTLRVGPSHLPVCLTHAVRRENG